MTPRPVTHSLVKVLRGVPGFDVLAETELLRVVGASVNLFWAAGSYVFTKGSQGDALYVVLSGKVKILDEVGGREVEVAEIRPGDFFGEMALLLETRHTKNVLAVEDSELLVLAQDAFRALLELKPDLDDLVKRRLDERRAHTARILDTDQATGA